MKEKNLILFEVEKVEKLERPDKDNHKIALVTFSFPGCPGLRSNDLFWLAKPHIEKLVSFFKSIGEINIGERRHKMNWDNLVGKRGICELQENSYMIKRYVYFYPEAIGLFYEYDDGDEEN